MFHIKSRTDGRTSGKVEQMLLISKWEHILLKGKTQNSGEYDMVLISALCGNIILKLPCETGKSTGDFTSLSMFLTRPLYGTGYYLPVMSGLDII